MKRVIVHPSFMNVSFIEAHNILSKMEQGEAIFRPSSKVSEINNNINYYYYYVHRVLIN